MEGEEITRRIYRERSCCGEDEECKEKISEPNNTFLDQLHRLTSRYGGELRLVMTAIE